MAKRAEIETKISGTDAGIRDLGGLENAFERLGKTSQSTGALLRDMHKEWSKPTAISTSIVKMGAQVLGGQIRDAASAIAEPAKTSYAQALAKATEWRDATQRIATSTGQGYAAVGEQVNSTAQRLGLLPGRVSDYSRSVRQLTGDWQGAMSGLDAYQNRALKTDRTIEELIPTASALATTFGLKATDDVNRFFGTLDRQAKNAGMSAEVAERAFMSASGSLAMITNAKPQQLSALTTGIMAGAPTPEMGAARISGITGFIDSHDRYIEARMRKAGKLKKGEHLRDEQGLIQGEKLFDAMEFVQGDLSKFYGTKDRRELVGRIGQSGMMAPQIAAGLFGLDVKKLRAQAAVQPNAGWDANVTPDFLATAAGKRTQYEARKDVRDIGLGSTLLPAQDAAVSIGGGAAGVAIASAGSVIAKAADTFWHAVEIFAGKAGGSAAGAAAGTAAAAGAGAAGGGAGTAALTGTLGAAAMPIGLGLGALGVGAGVWYAAGENEKEEERKQKEREDAKRQGFSSVNAMKFQQSRLGLDVAPAATETGRGYDLDRPINLGPAPASPREMADAIAKALAGQTLRVQSVAPAPPPQGQAQPL